MLKILVVVLMTGMTPTGSQDLYVFTDPKFDTIAECQAWSQGNVPAITYSVRREYGTRPIEEIYCMREELLKKFLEDPKSQFKNV
jgi:hypothetical protein|tara:strand:- start:617 stop:871 length:255 start_codon:yes stop_codon:yes gene_type:complete